MAASEDVQYFQFDSLGNMYVYEAGSGFSGPAIKVEPGFEMGEVTEMTPNLSLSSNVQATSVETRSESVTLLQVEPKIESENCSQTSTKR